MTEWLAVARALHVAAIVHWIGGLWFVTLVILPGLAKIEPPRRGVLFDAMERRFAAWARVSILVAGASGFYMLDRFGLWDRIADPHAWWLAAMVGLWVVFAVMLFVAEPLFLHAWFDKRVSADPDGAFRLALLMHRVLSLAALITVLGAVGGAHGLF